MEAEVLKKHCPLLLGLPHLNHVSLETKFIVDTKGTLWHSTKLTLYLDLPLNLASKRVSIRVESDIDIFDHVDPNDVLLVSDWLRSPRIGPGGLHRKLDQLLGIRLDTNVQASLDNIMLEHFGFCDLRDSVIENLVEELVDEHVVLSDD